MKYLVIFVQLMFMYVNAFCSEWNISHQVITDPTLMRPIYKNNKFFNPVPYSPSFFHEMSQFFHAKINNTSFDYHRLYDPDIVLLLSEMLRIQWIGHSCFLIQMDGINILTDPVFDNFHPLLGGHLYKRQVPPGIAINDLPKIDFLIISHNHYDHLEEKAILQLVKDQPHVLVPLGLKTFFTERGYKHVYENTWWEETIFHNKQNTEVFACVPAVHESRNRDWMKKNSSLWCGWIISNAKHTLYFAGDTAFNEKMFSQIGSLFSIDIAMLPIAPLHAIDKHLDPRQAHDAYKLLSAKKLLPMHWGSYIMDNKPLQEPTLELKKEMQDQENLIELKIGQAYE